MTDAFPRINITIPTFNRLGFTRRCLASLKKHTTWPHVVTVVDNASEDGTREYLREAKRDGLVDNLFLLKRNMGVSCACNTGWSAEDAPLYMKLDNDMEVAGPGWLEAILEPLREVLDQSLIGPRLPTCPHPFEEVALPSGRRVLAALTSVSGAATIVPRAVHERLGFWNEDYGLYGHEDADYSHRARLAGFRLLAYPTGGLFEYLGAVDDSAQDYVAFKSRAREANLAKTRLFNINCYLYNVGLRDIHVRPKYILRREDDGLWSFDLDPADMALRKFLFECRRRIFEELPAAERERIIYSAEFVESLRALGREMLGAGRGGPGKPLAAGEKPA